MEFLLLFLLVVMGIYSSFCFITLFITGKRSNKHTLAPIAVGEWPVLGHLHLLIGGRELLHHTLGRMADKHGPVFRLRLGSKDGLVISNTEIVKECFTINDKSLSSRSESLAVKHICYDNANFAFVPYSPYWRKMRRIVNQEVLSGRGLQMVQQVFDLELNRWLKGLCEMLNQETTGQPVLVDLQELLHNLSLNVFAKVVAGKVFESASCEEAKSWRDLNVKLFHMLGMFVVSDVLPSLRWLDWKVEKEMKKAGKEFDILLESWLEEHKRGRTVRKVDGKGDDTQDLMDLLLSLKEKGELGDFSVDEDASIKATCQSMIAGGTDTTPSAVIWAISLLLNNQSALDRARKEIDNHVGFNRQACASDVKDLVYVKAVVKESMRMHPVGPVASLRESSEDCTVGGYYVPAGTRLLINLWKIHRDPAVWSDPSEFLPERFMTSHAHVELKGSKHSELLPFTAGRRSCPGADFAIHSVHLALIRILHAFAFTSAEGYPVDMTETPGIVARKVIPLKVFISPRQATRMYC